MTVNFDHMTAGERVSRSVSTGLVQVIPFCSDAIRLLWSFTIVSRSSDLQSPSRLSAGSSFVQFVRRRPGRTVCLHINIQPRFTVLVHCHMLMISHRKYLGASTTSRVGLIGRYTLMLRCTFGSSHSHTHC